MEISFSLPARIEWLAVQEADKWVEWYVKLTHYRMLVFSDTAPFVTTHPESAKPSLGESLLIECGGAGSSASQQCSVKVAAAFHVLGPGISSRSVERFCYPHCSTYCSCVQFLRMSSRFFHGFT